MASGLEVLLKLDSVENRKKFVHGVVNSLCEKEGIHYEDYAQQLTLSEYANLKSSLTDVIKKTAREGMERKTLTETLKKLDVPQEINEIITECMWVREDEINSQLIQDASSISCCSLRDFDWKTKLVLASDKLGFIQEPLLSLDLTLNEGEKLKSETLELSQDELNKLVSALEAANKAVLQLRT